MKQLKAVISAIILLSTMLLSFSSLSEQIDLSSLSFEELSLLKQSLDLEYYSRPESEGFYLTEGTFIVGKDVYPGDYYIAMVAPDVDDSQSIINVWDMKEDFENDGNGRNSKLTKFHDVLNLGETPVMLSLDESDIINISRGSMYFSHRLFMPSDVYSYELPEGTYVPGGLYKVGVDIPSGRYLVYAGKLNGSYYSIRVESIDEEGKTVTESKAVMEFVRVYSEPFCHQIVLEDGEIFVAHDPVVMKKGPSLVFD